MSAHRTYPEYLRSGIQLVDAIPAGWVATPIKVVGELHGGAGFPHDEQGKEDQKIEFHKVNALGRADRYDFLTESSNTISEKTAARLRAYVFPPKSIVFAKVGAALLLSRFRWLRRWACLDNNMMGLVTRPGHASAYVKYALSIIPMSYVANPGAVPSINETKVGRLRIALPSLKEQTQIAKFLDYETSRIDALIDKQQQLIALLKEKRQAVINHAVTKGLNPNAPMRDSGIEWLGEIPAHWETKQVRHLTRQMGGGTPAKDNESFWGGVIPWVSPKDMKVDYISKSQDTVTEAAVAWSAAKLIPVGSVLVVVRGMILDHSVPTALTTSVVTINQDMKALIPLKCINGEFLLFLLQGLRDYLLSHTDSSAHGTKCLATGRLERTTIALPPVEEQGELISRLKARLFRIDTLNKNAAQVAELLKERRTALISAAVTGKIDIRDWTPPAETAATQETP
ncbi:MAG: type I restriction enzyme S subunit [Polyangiales bacterium]